MVLAPPLTPKLLVTSGRAASWCAALLYSKRCGRIAPNAGVAELADARDSKSRALHWA